jgi:TonB-dependent receptor-like protein/carboxypeptidase family protein
VGSAQRWSGDRVRLVVLAAASALAAATAARAQLQLSVVSGRVLGPDGAAVADARVALRDPLGEAIATVTTDREGRFRLGNVAPGVYHLGAAAPPLRSAVQRITVSGGLPMEVDLRLAAHLSESVAVASDESAAGGSSRTALAGEAVRRAPTALRGNALRSAVATTPGWTSEDNGLVHYRGVDDGLLFVIDGVPVYERLDPQFGVGFDATTLQSVQVLSGYIAPEFGLRSGGVIEVRSRGAAVDSWAGLLEAGAGSHDTQALAGLAQGPLGARASLTVSLAGERTARFLDPVSLDNLHNTGSSGGGQAELVFAPGADLLTLRGGHWRSRLDVPNAELQEAAGQDQGQHHGQTFGTLNWQRAWSEAVVSQAALFGRFTDSQLFPSAFDTPLSTGGDREQDRLGLLAAVTVERGHHRFKGGLEASQVRLEESFGFFVTDAEHGQDANLSEAALAHGPDDPFQFEGGVRRPVYSFYVQDSWRPRDHLTMDLGVRYDRSRLLLSESQWSPRAGVSYRLGGATLRASFNRFFQPPQTEYLLLSSSPEAQALSPFVEELGSGGAEIRAERQSAVELGAAFWLGGALRADIAVWKRWIRNQGDPNVFFATTVIFPNAVDRGEARGLDLRLELMRRRGLSGFVTYTLARIDQWGPINGGLFLEDDILEIGPGTPFTPDHDQRHALSAEAGYENEKLGLRVTLSGRYRTGTPLELEEDGLDEIAARPGADLVDFEAGRVKPYTVLDVQAGQRLVRRDAVELEVRAALLNLADARYAFNFGNPFSGTHFGPPRTLRFDLRLKTR